MWRMSILSSGLADQQDMKSFGPQRTQLQEILFVWLKMLLNIWISDLGFRAAWFA